MHLYQLVTGRLKLNFNNYPFNCLFSDCNLIFCFQEAYKHDAVLDLKHLYCNDIHLMAGTYGIEAAYRVILKVKFTSLYQKTKISSSREVEFCALGLL